MVPDGAVITRTTKGINDDEIGEYFDGYMFVPEVEIPITGTLTNDYQTKLDIQKIIKGEFDDYQPDEFYFNIGNYAGKFYIKPGHVVPTDENNYYDLNLITVPYTKIKFEYKYNLNESRIEKIKATTPDGIVYIFDIHEYTTTETNDAVTFDAVSSWYLSKIIG